MRPFESTVERGVNRGEGYSPERPGSLLRARNSRYLPSDEHGLWALLGRAKFNAAPIPAAATPSADESKSKRVFGFDYDDGERVLIVHKGASLWAATAGVTGAFTEEKAIAATTTVQGWAVSFLDVGYYTMKNPDGVYTLARLAGGTWRVAGHREPDTGLKAWSAIPTGSGAIGSTTAVLYTVRIYDENTNTESQHGEVVTLEPFADAAFVNLFWLNGVNLRDLVNPELGTHLRIYRSFFNEPAGVLYRIDGSDAGIPLATAGVGHYSFRDDVSNLTAQLQGVVRADGLEGTIAWAEHGGAPPRAGGQIVFQEHMVWWDVDGRPGDILYSAKGYPETCPVDFDGVYQYYLPIITDKSDAILWCGIAGTNLVALCSESMWRISTLPTYADPAFARDSQVPISTEDGIVGRYAAASFGTNARQSQLILYVSPVHGPCVTDGYFKRQILPSLFWESIIEPSRLSSIEVVDYPRMQEVWIFYTAKGKAGLGRNTEALIVDYSSQSRDSSSLPRFRVTWPVDVIANAAYYGSAADGVRRLYLVGNDDGTVYVQDQGDRDTQQNTKAGNTEIVVEWNLPRVFPRGMTQAVHVGRALVHGISGAEREFTVRHYAIDGGIEYRELDKVLVGPGEGSDYYHADSAGQGHRVELSYQGPTGSTYDQGAAGQAPCLRRVIYETAMLGRQGATRNQP